MTRKQAKPKARSIFLARMNGEVPDKLFAAQAEALAFVEKESATRCLSGCQVVEFNEKGEQVSVLSLNVKLEPTYAWSDHG